MHGLALFALLSGLNLTAFAAEAAPAAAAPAAAPVGAEVGLRSEYLLGERILVPITLSNSSSTPLSVPDLSNRPWLVGFEIVAADGKTQRRRTATPATDSGRTLTLAPRARRFTLLEVPSSGAMPAGRYALTVSVDLGGQQATVGPTDIQVVPARPVGGRLGFPGRGAVDSLWLHGASAGADLYLHQLDADSLKRSTGNWFLGHLDGPVDPWLSNSRGSDAGSRYVVWSSGPREIAYAQLLGGTALDGAPASAIAPWPVVEIAGEPLMDGRGRLLVPLWVPAPKGASGELRLLAFDSRGRPFYRKVLALDRRPAVATAVDDAGNAHLLVRYGDKIDLYTERADQDRAGELPMAGRRLLQGLPTAPLEDARFVVMPRGETQAGGLSVWVTARAADGFRTQVLSLKGAKVADLPLVPLPGSTAPLIAVVPGGWNEPGVVLSTEGQLRLETPSGTAALPGVDPSRADWKVLRGADGAPVLLRLSPEGPVQTTPLAVRPRG